MSARLVKLSESRWQFTTAKRVYYVRQVKAPNEDLREPGVYQVDAGGASVCVVAAESVEQLVGDIRHAAGSTGDPR